MEGPIEFSCETISPRTAAAMLEKNAANRKPSRKVVREYAGAMARGEWIRNGETIKFDVDGNLRDGQHRLHAIIHCGRSIRLDVCRNIARRAYLTVDTGKGRTAGDCVSIHAATRGMKTKYQTAIGTALRLIHYYPSERWDQMMPGKFGRMTNVQCAAALETHPGIFEAAETALRQPYRCENIPQSANVFAFYMAMSVDRRLCLSFFEELGTGGYPKGKTRNAAEQLRKRLMDVDAEEVPTAFMAKLGWVIDAFSYYVDGGKVPRFTRLPERLPRFRPEPKFVRKRTRSI